MKKKRILKSEKFLQALLATNDQFYVGLLLEDVVKCENLKKYVDPKNLDNGYTFKPLPKGPTTRTNLYGKFVRKEPNERTAKSVHISFRNKWNTLIEYDKSFYVYVKVLKHKFEIEFSCRKNEHGQMMLVSPLLLFDNTEISNMKNTHIINLFLEIFGEFEIYTSSLEPALAFTNKYDFEVLPKSKMDDTDITYLVEKSRRFIRNEQEVRAYQKRLQILNEYNAQIVGKGSKGFFGYIVFGFEKSNTVILESMYNGNATYVFDMNEYESLIAIGKQNILTMRLAKRRFMHSKNWETKVRRYLSKISA